MTVDDTAAFHFHWDARPIHGHAHPGPKDDPHAGYWIDIPSGFWVKHGERLPGEVTTAERKP